MQNAEMNDSLVKALDPQLIRKALKKIANHRSTELEPQFPFSQLVEKIYEEDITRTHIDRHKLNTNATFSSSIISLPFDIVYLTEDDIHMTEQDIEVTSNNLTGKPLTFSYRS